MNGFAAAPRQLGRPLVHYRQCGSTNDVAKTLAGQGAPHGTVVAAYEQTAGRGRQGRHWVAPPGSALLCSTIVRPLREHHRLAPLAAGLAVSETCEELAGVRCQIKWPNDVWIDGRKVAGILVEARPDASVDASWAVIGIGLNTRVDLSTMPEELQHTATTLDLAPGVDPLMPLLAKLERWLDTTPSTVIAAWRTRDVLLGRRIGWADGTGEATGIDEHGNLVVRLPNGSLTTLSAGEVHLSLH
jgi:BirA family biotin operon repressor/biotin-[acetyl-CoA-carboxylase] ligase